MRGGNNADEKRRKKKKVKEQQLRYQRLHHDEEEEDHHHDVELSNVTAEGRSGNRISRETMRHDLMGQLDRVASYQEEEEEGDYLNAQQISGMGRLSIADAFRRLQTDEEEEVEEEGGDIRAPQDVGLTDGNMKGRGGRGQQQQQQQQRDSLINPTKSGEDLTGSRPTTSKNNSRSSTPTTTGTSTTPGEGMPTGGTNPFRNVNRDSTSIPSPGRGQQQQYTPLPNDTAINTITQNNDTSMESAVNPFLIDFDDNADDYYYHNEKEVLSKSFEEDVISDDDDDDDDDDEDIIQRYSFDFRLSSSLDSMENSHRVRTYSTTSSTGGGGGGMMNYLIPTPPQGKKSFTSKKLSSSSAAIATADNDDNNNNHRQFQTPNPVRRVIRHVQSARAKSRRRRAERILSLSDRGWVVENEFRTRFIVCVSSWCDLNDIRGVGLMVGVVIMFVLTYKWLDLLEDSENSRRLLLRIGIPLILIRILWRPIYWLVWGRRIEKRRQATMALYDGLNGEHGTGGIEIPTAAADDYDDAADRFHLEVHDNVELT